MGLSLGVLLAQHNDVITLHILGEKVNPINKRISLIKDAYIKKFTEKDLGLKSTTDGATAYSSAEFVIVAVPTNCDPQKNFFDCSAVESVMNHVMNVNPSATIVIINLATKYF